MPEMKGDGIDMNQLMDLFACKSPPDNTIVRIEELEKQMKDAMNRLNNVGSGEPSGEGMPDGFMDKFNDLVGRV